MKRHRHHPFLSLAPWVAAASLAACRTVGPDHEAPETALPAAWRDAPEAGLAAGTPELAAWWATFGDPVLADLVERAVSGGLELRDALARIREARALRGVAASERFPVLDGELRFERRGESENTPLGGFVPDSDLYSAGFDASWEIDLWGRVRRSVEAADADLASAVEDARDVAVSVAAEVAATYVALRANQRRLEIARENVSLQEETLQVVSGRFEAGLVDESDVAQARANVETTRSRLPDLEIGSRVAENRLAVLLGRPPGSLAAELEEPRPIPVPPASIAVGVPADLLRRRADVRRAERVLAAETARIGMAEGDLYPRLTLFGALGVAAESSSDLADADSSFFGIGPSLRWNLFDGGGLRNRVAAQEARAEAALVRWERTVLAALEETENAMTAFVREQSRRDFLLEAVAQSRLAVELAQVRYVEGLSDFQAVLDSERALARLEDDLAVSEASITASSIGLYKSLGGGFEGGPPSPALAAGGYDRPARTHQ